MKNIIYVLFLYDYLLVEPLRANAASFFRTNQKLIRIAKRKYYVLVFQRHVLVGDDVPRLFVILY